MNRREFIKSAIVGSLAASVPVVTISSEPAGEWMDMPDFYKHALMYELRVGDTFEKYNRPEFVVGQKGAIPLTYTSYMVTAIRGDMVKVIRVHA